VGGAFHVFTGFIPAEANGADRFPTAINYPSLKGDIIPRSHLE